MIAEDVPDLAAHGARMLDPDGYRPARCARCGHGTLHAHDFVERVARGTSATPIALRRYACACADCGAIWRVLPAFVPRHLHFAWRSVEATVDPTPNAPPLPPPSPPSPRTRRRWLGRLSSSARVIVQVLAALAQHALGPVLDAVVHGLGASRVEVVTAYATALGVPNGAQLSTLAGHLHRLMAGIRLM